MKVGAKNLMAVVITATFALSSVSRAQMSFGYGQYGGNVPCGYQNGPAPGAVSYDDDYADLLQTRKDLESEIKSIECQLRDGRCEGDDSIERKRKRAEDEITSDFLPGFAKSFTDHIANHKNCSICGQSIANPEPGGYLPPRPAPVAVTPVVAAPAPPLVTPSKQGDPNLPFRTPPTQSAPAQSVPDDQDDPDTAPRRLGTYKQCLAKFKTQITKAGLKPGSRLTEWCRNKGYSAQYDAMPDDLMNPGNGRMPASVDGGQSRMPASFTGGGSEMGRQGSAPSAGADVPTAPAPADDSIPDFDPGLTGGTSNGAPVTCYHVYDPEVVRGSRPARFKSSFAQACMDGGRINPRVCDNAGYLQSRVDVSKCRSALADLERYTREVERLQKQNTDLKNELENVRTDIADWKREHKNGKMSEDDQILAAREQKIKSASVKTGPSFGQALLSVGLGAAAGLGTYALVNGQERAGYRDYVSSVNQYNSQAEALGWTGTTPLPYRSSGAGLGAGMMMFSGVTGGLLGSFGCGSMSGGANPALFGNPYAMNPYATVGGGMYNGVGPWGMAGPWGNGMGTGFGGQYPYGYAQGFMMGGAIGGVIGGGYAAGGGYPYGGAIGGGYPYGGALGGGYPYGGALGGGYPYGGAIGGGYPYGGAIGGAIGAAIGGGFTFGGGPLGGGYPYGGAIGGPLGGGYVYGGALGGPLGGAIGGAIGGPFGGGYAAGGAIGGAIGGPFGGGYAYGGGDPRGTQQAQQIQAQQLIQQIYGAQGQLGLLQSGALGLGGGGYTGAYGGVLGGVYGSGLGGYSGYGGGYGTALGSTYFPYGYGGNGSVYGSVLTNPYLSGYTSGSILSTTPTINPGTTTIPTNSR